MKPLIFIIGLAIGAGVYYLLTDSGAAETVRERWVHDTTSVKLIDTVTLKGTITYRDRTIHDTTRFVTHDSIWTATNTAIPDTLPKEIDNISAVSVLHRGRDSVGIVITYFFPPKNEFRLRSQWNQDSYKEVTIEKKNKFGLGFYGGVGMTPKGFQPVIGVGAFYRIEFNLKDLF